jgi:RHS repeat-associated protein
MFYNADSGLYLTEYRAYDPVSSRWLSRDPVGEIGDPSANLYRYVNGDPIGLVDRRGLAGGIPDPNGVVPGGPWTPAGAGQRDGSYYGPPKPGGRDMCQWVPPENEGGPPGSQGYWKTKTPTTSWQRYSTQGVPLGPDEAHPNPLPSNPIPPFIRRGGGIGVFLGAFFQSRPAY